MSFTIKATITSNPLQGFHFTFSKLKITLFIIYLAGGWCFLGNMIGSPISEYPALFTSEQSIMASSYVYFTEEELFFNKRSRRARHHQKSNKIWDFSIQRYVFLPFLSDKSIQGVFQCFQMMSGRQANIL